MKTLVLLVLVVSTLLCLSASLCQAASITITEDLAPGDVPETTAAGDTVTGTYTVDAVTNPEDGEDDEIVPGTILWSITGRDQRHFSISGIAATATLTFTIPMDLNFEPKPSYSVTVRVSAVVETTVADGDNRMSTVVSTHDVTVSIDDADDAGKVTLNPTSPKVGGRVTATLKDEDGKSGEIWTWKRGSPSPGTILVATGQSYTPVEADVGAVGSENLHVSVTYTDGYTGNLTKTIPTAVAVTSDNRAPVIGGFASSINYGEDLKDPVETYTATDADTDDTLAWSITHGSADFKVEKGVVTFKESPNFEARSSYTFTVHVSDGTLSDSHTVTVNILNVQEDGEVTFVPEIARVRQSVMAGLDDGDGKSDETWTWTGGNAAVTDSASYTPVNDDVTLHLTATVTYTDGYDGAEVTISKRIGPVLPAMNTGAPTVTLDSGGSTVAVPENTAILVSFSATDPDNDPITWGDLTGTDSGKFTLTKNNGSATLESIEDPDYETQDSYSVTVTASDGDNPHSLPVTITITNQDDDGTLEVHADARVGQTLKAVFMDQDGVSGELWEWTRTTGPLLVSTSDTYLVVEADTGGLTLNASYIDGFDNQREYDSATIAVTSHNTAPVLNTPVVTDPVTFETGTTNIILYPENEAVAVVVASYTAADTDSLTWSITSGSADFDVSTAGVVTFKTPPNYEVRRSYSFTVQVSDRLETDSHTATVRVTDADDTGVVTFNPQVARVGQRITATLEDEDGYSGLTWEWTGGSATTTNQASYTPVEADGTDSVTLTATATYTNRRGGNPAEIELAPALSVRCKPPPASERPGL